MDHERYAAAVLIAVTLVAAVAVSLAHPLSGPAPEPDAPPRADASSAPSVDGSEAWRLGPERLNREYRRCALDHGFDPQGVQVIVASAVPAAVKTGLEVPAKVHRPCLVAIGGADPWSSSYGRREPAAATRHAKSADTRLPIRSGHGRRVVFSEGRQRVWLVDGRGRVRRTYLVSGGVEDDLDRGTYAVFSRSMRAWALDGAGTMRFMVRFAEGDRAAIGFHDIPVDDGRPVQTAAELGTPQSHGCIRQKRADAIALWDFAPLGTTVVVTA